MNDITLGSMLPDKFYPIIGSIIIYNVETEQPILYGTCKIPKYNLIEQNDYIYVNGNYEIKGYRNTTNVITINADDVPMSIKYSITAKVDDEKFNRMQINGLCRVNSEITINFDSYTSGDMSIKLIPMRQVNKDKNEIKLCDIYVWDD